MATLELDEGQVQQVAEFLRERMRVEHSHDKDMDPRDIDRVQTDPRYAYRFARQRMATGGDEYDSLKMLVTALQFRCSYGVNDLTFQDINKELLHMGICYPRGQDLEGSDIVYLHIRMHKKEKEKGEQLKRFALYFLEKHDRHFPNRKMSLFMDCSDAGYSNMDMDLVKFIISLFKQFYPMKLGSIYVYEMPWVMNAGWSIIKSWLSPAARNKMRFIQKQSIWDYFTKDQLTARYGGTDPWKYQYPPNDGLEGEGLQRILPLLQNERENEQEIQALVTEMVYRYEHDGAMPPPVEKQVVKDDTDINEVNPAPVEISEERDEDLLNVKKVHFVQEREESPVIPSKAVNSRGIMKHTITLDNNTPPQQHVGILLDVAPPTELLFHPRDKIPKCNLTLTNLSSNLVSFKIKTTTPNNFKVQPSMGVIDSRGQFVVNITCQAEDLNQIKDDKFLIQSTSLNPDSKTGQTELNYHWRTVATEHILENRLKCRISDSVNNLFTNEESKQTNKQPLETPQNQDLIGLVRSVGNLLMEVEHMHGILKKIYTLVIGLAFVNFVLIVILLRA